MGDWKPRHKQLRGECATSVGSGGCLIREGARRTTLSSKASPFVPSKTEKKVQATPHWLAQAFQATPHWLAQAFLGCVLAGGFLWSYGVMPGTLILTVFFMMVGRLKQWSGFSMCEQMQIGPASTSILSSLGMKSGQSSGSNTHAGDLSNESSSENSCSESSQMLCAQDSDKMSPMWIKPSPAGTETQELLERLCVLLQGQQVSACQIPALLQQQVQPNAAFNAPCGDGPPGLEPPPGLQPPPGLRSPPGLHAPPPGAHQPHHVQYQRQPNPGFHQQHIQHQDSQWMYQQEQHWQHQQPQPQSTKPDQNLRRFLNNLQREVTTPLAEGLSLKEHLNEIQQLYDPGCVLAVRKINKLGFDSDKLLEAHFSYYGSVECVRISNSHVKVAYGSHQVEKVRPAAMGFVVMGTKAAADAILSAGPEQVVQGINIMVRSFTEQDKLAPKKE